MKGVIKASKSCEAWVDAAGIAVTRAKKTKGREDWLGPPFFRDFGRTKPVLPTFRIEERAFIFLEDALRSRYASCLLMLPVL
jgi:hypothetical protein